MRRTLHIITAALGVLGCFSALARGQEADLLPALLALDPAPQTIATTGTTPASPAPEAVFSTGTAQAVSSQPPAVGSFIGRIPVLSLDEAKASPKPDFFFVTDPIASRCPACEQAKRLFLDERLQRWLALFDVVVCHEVEGDARPSFPQWAFASSDWQRYKRFVPGNPDGQGVTVEGCMRRFHEAWGVVR